MTTLVAPSQGLMKWNETKWMRWVWRNGGMKFVVGKMGETPRKTYPDPFRPPRNPHGVTETRTRDPSGGRRASNHLRHEAALIGSFYYNYCIELNVWRYSFEDWTDCCHMAVKGALWLAKCSLNLNFSFFNRISLLLISSRYSIVSLGWMDPVPDPIFPEKILG